MNVQTYNAPCAVVAGSSGQFVSRADFVAEQASADNSARLRAAISDANRGLSGFAEKLVVVGNLLGFQPDESVADIAAKVRAKMAHQAVGESRHSYQVSVFQPALSHSVWMDWGSDDALSEAEVLDLLRAGVESGEYVGWRVVTIHQDVAGRDAVALARHKAGKGGA